MSEKAINIHMLYHITGLEGEEDSLEEISRGRKGGESGSDFSLGSSTPSFAEKVYNFLKTKSL